MSHGDLARIINSNEVQSVVRPARKDQVIHIKNKKNPLKNATLMEKLNPNDALRKKQTKTQNEANRKKRAEQLQKSRAGQKTTAQITKDQKQRKTASKKFMSNILQNIHLISEADKKEHQDFLELLNNERK